jgi:hypothetical protein
MKIPSFSLFSAKTDIGQEPERCSVARESQLRSVSQRQLLISLRSPNDQLQIIAFPVSAR